jgi:hypothetical protein
MTRIRRPYIVTDIEPVIAMVDAARWERETALQPRPERLFADDLMKQARVERSTYQRALLRRCAEFVVSLLPSPRQSVAKAQTKR